MSSSQSKLRSDLSQSQPSALKPPPTKAAPVVDLRSDTVTRPTPAMRQAMAAAEVGDDVYGEDPTVNRLEHRAAEVFAREAALFLPTGTMGNQIAIKLHTQSGQEVICESRAHVFNWEMATLASYSGCLVRPIASDSGNLTWRQIAPHVAPKIYYRAQTGLIVLENTHNMAGGAVSPLADMQEVCTQAHAAGIPVHLDGARIFNAATYLNKPVAEITRGFDSVMFCLSKGLGAPVGSMLVGSKSFIERARIVRKALGGGMRQAGILARDHENARLLAEGLARLPGVKLDLQQVHTNIVIIEVTAKALPAAEVLRRLAEQNILASAIGASQIRFVTHMDVERAACEAALRALQQIFS